MKSIGIFNKDWKSELRNRYAINSLAMFILVAVSVILFSVGNETLAPTVAGGLLWVVIFFSSMSGLSRVFVSEEERGTVLLLQLNAKPSTIFSGKLIFNLLLVFLINTTVLILFLLLFEQFVIANFPLFFLEFILANFGIAISSTIIAAIISKANSKGTLYPVLAFPILLPLILTVIELTKNAIDNYSFTESYAELLILFIYNGIMITASYLLFDFIWKE